MTTTAAPPEEHTTRLDRASSRRRHTKWSHIWAAVLVLAGLGSFLVLAPMASDPSTLSSVRASLDSQQTTVTGLAGTATAIAAGLSVVPGDALTPVADKLIEVSGWFVVIIVAIFVQKILVTVAGSIAFAVIVPIACVLGIVAIYSKRIVFRSLALRLAAFAVVLALAVPASIWASTALTATHASAATAANAVEDASDDAPAAGGDTEEASPSGGDAGFLGAIQNWIADAVDNVGNFVESAANTIDEVKDDAVRASEYYTEQFALLLVTTAIMPILVLLLLWWVIRMLFAVDIAAARMRSGVQADSMLRQTTRTHESATGDPREDRSQLAE